MLAGGEIGAGRPTDSYLAHRFRLDLLADLEDSLPPDKQQQFFLKHPDDKGDHILVDNAFNIVGIIDWEWTQTAPPSEAFSSPCMLWPVDKFYGGSNELAGEELRLAAIFQERGRDDLARYVVDGRKMQRFLFALGPDSSHADEDATVFAHLFAGLRDAFGDGDDDWQEWRRRAVEKWQDDELLLGLLATAGEPGQHRCGIDAAS
jgi:hypothetical protein